MQSLYRLAVTEEKRISGRPGHHANAQNANRTSQEKQDGTERKPKQVADPVTTARARERSKRGRQTRENMAAEEEARRRANDQTERRTGRKGCCGEMPWKGYQANKHDGGEEHRAKSRKEEHKAARNG